MLFIRFSFILRLSLLYNYSKEQLKKTLFINNLNNKNMNLKAKITYKVKDDMKCISLPYVETIEFNEERTNLFNKYGDDLLLKQWCEQVLKINHPKYECVIIHVEKLNS